MNINKKKQIASNIIKIPKKLSNAKIKTIRQAIIKTIPLGNSEYGNIPLLKQIYIPNLHIKALHIDCNLVIGGRGVGKTFWSSALRSGDVRELLGTLIPDLTKVEVQAGFGPDSNMKLYPDGQTFKKLLSDNIEPYDIWRTVLARWTAKLLSEKLPDTSWKKSLQWVTTHPEEFALRLERLNSQYKKNNKIGLIVFDSLDLSSTDWRTMDTITRDLLRVILFLKGFPRLHGKVFLREDLFYGHQVTDFPDASKLLSTRVDLSWALHDLHGLLWQYLCNASDTDGELLRGLYGQVVGSPPSQLANNVWGLADSVKREGEIQRSLFATLAGEMMGKDRRRGVPYTWTVGHLADARGRTSPRSFLSGIRAAAEDSAERYPDHLFPLHYESIKRGIQKASKNRVEELEQEYQWVQKLMAPLNGLNVPCTFESIEQRWMDEFGKQVKKTVFGERLPPEHHKKGWAGIRADLETLGILDSMKDGRVNMPDLYRVAFGLGRRGGVKPVARSSGG